MAARTRLIGHTPLDCDGHARPRASEPLRSGQRGGPAGHQLAAGWTKDTDWHLLGIIPYGRWHEEIVEWEPPERFVDSITGTPFPFWRHTHLYERRGESTLYTDRLEIDPGWMGPVGLWFIKLVWAPRLVKLRQHFEKARREP